ncbi:PepSY domain-containing protein [Rubritalea spongiae]|uniref:PepSY domain-containing protein n=1 Tax=Rubritalea spongiae TaxID=430797 RepID=A0ABW5E287_9BACT
MADPTTSMQTDFKPGCSPACDVVRKPKRRKRRSRAWHRWLGMVAALPLIWVLLTGFLLNHSDDFELDQKRVTSPFILKLYGMTPKGEPEIYQVYEQELAHWDGVSFLNGKAMELTQQPIGVAVGKNQIAVATAESVALYSLTGELLEVVDELSLPELPLINIGTSVDGIVVKNEQGWWLADSDWIEFSKVAEAEVEFQLAPVEVKDARTRSALATEWAGGGLPLARVILDLHAGHFCGAFAKYFYDFVIVCTLWLIGTGVVLQYRSSRRNRNVK